MRASAVRIKVEAPDSVDAHFCIEEYYRELAARFEPGFDPAKSISANAADLTPPAGAFVIARLGGHQSERSKRRRSQAHVGLCRCARARCRSTSSGNLGR